eukprot:PhM_4_TR18823/c0_g1_i1/m.48373/K14293/KPNB1, IPO1; importin subunit beta-1
MSSSVIQILIAATGGDKQAEAQIYAARDSGLAAFLLELVRIARSDDVDIRARQMALLVLKNTVAFNAKEDASKRELEARWSSVDPATRQVVRNEVLMTLGANTSNVRNIGAIVVANLARIELPRNEWPDLMSTLFTAAKNNDSMEAAIVTLGYICEESNHSSPLEEVLQHHSNDILGALMAGMRHDHLEIVYQSTAALRNSINFIHANMEREGERNYIMDTILGNAAGREDRTVATAIECLCCIAYEYYTNLEPYMNRIFDVTTRALSNPDNEPAVMNSFLFWSTVCDVEVDLLEQEDTYKEANEPLPEDFEFKRYAQGAATSVVPVTLKALLQQEESQTDEDWNVSTSAGVCLRRFASVLRNDIGGYVMPFINDNVSSSNWRNREAGVMAFAAIIEGPDTATIGSVIQGALPTLLSYVGPEQHPLVRDTSVWAIARVASFHTEVIMRVCLDDVMRTSVTLMSDSPTIANKACSIINNICVFLEDDDELPESNAISQYFRRIVDALIQTMDRNDSHEGGLRAACQETMNALLACAPADCLEIVQSLIPEFVNRINRSFEFMGPNASPQQIEDVRQMQGLMAGALQHIVRKLHDHITQEQAEMIMGAFQRILQVCQEVDEEVMMAVGALAFALGNNFQRFLLPMSSYFYQGLSPADDCHVLSVTVSTIGDIFSALGEAIPEPFVDEVMGRLTSALRGEEITRDVRPTIISCFGDIALHLGARFTKYLNVVLDILKAAATVASGLDIDDDEMYDFQVDLVTSVCEAYTGILQGLKCDPTPLVEGVVNILNFIGTCGAKPKVDDKILEMCVGLSGDVLNVFSDPKCRGMCGAVDNFVRNNEIQAMVNRASNHRQKDVRKAAQFALKQAQAYMQQ